MIDPDELVIRKVDLGMNNCGHPYNKPKMPPITPLDSKVEWFGYKVPLNKCQTESPNSNRQLCSVQLIQKIRNHESAIQYSSQWDQSKSLKTLRSENGLFIYICML